MSDTISLAVALAELQRNLPKVGKDKTARVTSQRTGRTHTYDYVNLATVSAAILPLMADLGLSFLCKPTFGPNGEFALVYRLLHVSGQSEDGLYPLPGSGSPQEIGSAITYARRYCLCAVTGVAPDEDDDDGQAAEGAARLVDEAREMRRKPPEVDEHGAATIAEQTRMMTGPEPGATRTKADEGNEPWYDSPKPLADLPNPEDAHGTATADQIKALQAKFTARGIKDRDAKIAWLVDKFGADIHSSKDLSYTQAAQALQELR